MPADHKCNKLDDVHTHKQFGRSMELPSSYLQIVAAFQEALLNFGQLIIAQIQSPEELQVLELSGAKHRVEVVSEEVVSQLDGLESVLDSVKEPLGQPPDVVVGEVHPGQREVGGCEQLRPQRLQPSVLLAELLDVVPVREERELGEDGPVAVDDRGVDLVEATAAGIGQLRVELGAGNHDGLRGGQGDR